MRSQLLALAALLHVWIRGTSVSAYPVILAIDESTERCFQVNIPEDDDVHMIIVPIPSSDDLESEELEVWYVEQVYKMARKKTAKGGFPNQFLDEPPDRVAETMSEYLKENYANGAPIKVKLSIRSFDGKTAMTNYRTKFFQPLTMARVRNVGKHLNDDIEGAEVCIENNTQEGETFHVIFESMLDSEELPGAAAEGFQKDAHLTPLEESLEKSIVSARNVLKEMDYMEKREKRMRITSDSINSRVQWFSYLSVAILFVVTYVQVTYLRRYFHKKKLM